MLQKCPYSQRFLQKVDFREKKFKFRDFLSKNVEIREISQKKGKLSEKMEIPRLFRAQFFKEKNVDFCDKRENYMIKNTKVSISARKKMQILRFIEQKCRIP